MEYNNEFAKIYDTYKNLKVFFLEEDYPQVLKLIIELVNSIIQIDDILCYFLENENFVYKYSTLEDNENDIIKKYQFILEQNHDYQSQEENYDFIYPIYYHQEKVGYIVFSNHHSLKCWSVKEQSHLQNIAHFLENMFVNQTLYAQLSFNESVFNKVLNSINANIYMTDPQTDEILYVNEQMQKTRRLNHPVGKKCWEVLKEGKHERCQQCPISYLIQHPSQPISWQEFNNENQRIYQNYDCIIEWFDKRPIHIQHSVDITDIVQIKKEASFDELTGVYNRRAGKKELAQQILKAQKQQKNIVVCLYDIDHLKLTNDVFGHHEGDYMIKSIVETLQPLLKKDDLFMRLSGDEFIVSMYDVHMSEANLIMHQALENLQLKVQVEQLPYSLSFCFGLYKVEPHNSLSINDIITNADEKMYIWKKKSHLRTAIDNLKNQSPIMQEFDYNHDLLYDALAKSTDDYIFICNMKTNVFKYTQAMVEEFDFPSQILTNAAAVFGSKIHKDDKYEFLNSNQQITDGRTDSHIVEYRALNKNNEYVWLRCRGHVEYDENGEPSIFAGFISNLGKKNYRDSLTGLYNQFEFEKRIKELTGDYAIMILNIRDFKSINQLYDRDFGDTILRIIGQNLQTILHRETTVFKLEGDEFGLIVKDTHSDALQNLFQKIQDYSDKQHAYEDRPFTCQFNAGAAIYPKHGHNYLELRKNCEIALQYSKRDVQNKLIIFNDSLFKEKTYTLQLINTLKHNIANDFQYFSLAFQPKVTSYDHCIMGFEVLCRWHHPEFPNVGPGQFIPLLENTGDIVVLGNWIFQQSVQILKSWLTFNDQIKISINVSSIQLLDEDFVAFVNETLQYYQVEASHIIIELTETSIAKNTGMAIETIKKLKSLGIKIAMDDFGTGYSSLSLLRDEPLDIIKIDQSFVRGIKEDAYNYAFMKFIIDLCHQLHLKVVVEGVETQEELKIIESFQPDYIQGYYTGRPMPFQVVNKKIVDNCHTNR